MRRTSNRLLPGVLMVFVGAAALSAPLPQAKPKPVRNAVVEMKVAGRGKVTIELFAKDAPKTVARITTLVKQGFYNGLRFHRVRPGYMAQVGDPESKLYSAAQLKPMKDEDLQRIGLGGGGSGKKIPFEENGRTHETGTLAMALSAERSDTADSQFFVNLAPNHHLDGNYCVFGRVTKGMDVVKKIKQGDQIEAVRVVRR
jgi:peptidyl-prolyl cis-trans isomerase B (cyclophilin B)